MLSVANFHPAIRKATTFKADQFTSIYKIFS
jgi:hypothetical protein